MQYVFRWFPSSLSNTCPYRPLLFAIDAVLLLDMGVHSLVDESRGCISLAAKVETVFWQERLVDAHGLFSRSECGSGAHGRRSLLVEDSLHRITEDPDVSKGQRDRDAQENELVARPLVPLCSVVIVVSLSRTLIFRSACISARVNLTLLMASKSSCSGYAGWKLADKTKVKNLLIGLCAGGESAILYGEIW